MEVYSLATARTAAHFLTALKERSPYPMSAIQVDGGSEFMAQFEATCKESKVRLYALPPRSPKLDGHVERAQRTHTEEFWERLYNTIRTHQALAGRTPAEYLAKCHPETAPAAVLSHI